MRSPLFPYDPDNPASRETSNEVGDYHIDDATDAYDAYHRHTISHVTIKPHDMFPKACKVLIYFAYQSSNRGVKRISGHCFWTIV